MFLIADIAASGRVQYYLDHQAELAKQFEGRYVVIKNGAVLGDYKTAAEAVRRTAREHAPGTFLVQLCDADPESVKAHVPFAGAVA